MDEKEPVIHGDSWNFPDGFRMLDLVKVFQTGIFTVGIP